MKKTKLITPKVRNTGREYDSLLSRKIETVDNPGADEWRQLARDMTIEKEIDDDEAEARRLLQAAGYIADDWWDLSIGGKAEPLSQVEFAANMLRHIDGLRTAIKNNDARSAAWHASRIEENKWMAYVRSIELATRIGERIQRAPGRVVVTTQDKKRMQDAAAKVWAVEPNASVNDVAARIAAEFGWAARTIRRHIRR